MQSQSKAETKEEKGKSKGRRGHWQWHWESEDTTEAGGDDTLSPAPAQSGDAALDLHQTGRAEAALSRWLAL